MTPFLVGSFEGLGNLEGECEGFFDRDGPTLQPFRQRVAFDEFEDKEPGAFVFFESVDRGDVRMVQRRQQLRFTFKPGQTLFVLGELFGESLDGDFAPELGVLGTPHLTHAALAERGKDFVAAELGAGVIGLAIQPSS